MPQVWARGSKVQHAEGADRRISRSTTQQSQKKSRLVHPDTFWYFLSGLVDSEIRVINPAIRRSEGREAAEVRVSFRC